MKGEAMRGRRAIIVGDSVCIREDCTEFLSRRFMRAIDPHVPMFVDDVERIKGRRLLHLLGGYIRVWPCEVNLTSGPVEREYRRALAWVTAHTAAKAEREAKRRRPKLKAKKESKSQ
jgi:hypothetical protein